MWCLHCRYSYLTGYKDGIGHTHTGLICRCSTTKPEILDCFFGKSWYKGCPAFHEIIDEAFTAPKRTRL